MSTKPDLWFWDLKKFLAYQEDTVSTKGACHATPIVTFRDQTWWGWRVLCLCSPHFTEKEVKAKGRWVRFQIPQIPDTICPGTCLRTGLQFPLMPSLLALSISHCLRTESISAEHRRCARCWNFTSLTARECVRLEQMVVLQIENKKYDAPPPCRCGHC